MSTKLRSKYAVVELNNVAGVRTGELVSQYPMASGVEQLENGMLVVVDHFKGEVKMPSGTDDVVYLHASVEKLYNGEGRNEFVLKKDSFLPRCYKLGLGDTFETNAVKHDKGSVSALAGDINETQGYGVPSTDGFIEYKTASTGTAKVELKAVAVVTLPNGEMGVKWRVIKAVA